MCRGSETDGSNVLSLAQTKPCYRVECMPQQVMNVSMGLFERLLPDTDNHASAFPRQ